MFRRLLTVSLIAGASTGLIVHEAHAQTMITSGNLVGTQTWNAAGSPYIISGDVAVATGNTLTIEAGTEVRFNTGDNLGSGTDTARAELRVEGTLLTQGTAMAPVRFTSNAMTPAARNYYGIVVLPNGSATLAGVSIEYADAGVRDESTNGATISGSEISNCRYGIWVTGGGAMITTSTLRNNTSDGIFVQSGPDVTITSVTIRNNTRYGIYAENAEVQVTQSTLRDNGNRAIYLTSWIAGTFESSIVHNTIVNNSTAGVYVTESTGTLRATIRDNVIVGNATYGIFNSSGIITRSNNLVWSQTNNWSGTTQGAGSFSENPLFADEAGDDYRPTSRSALRNGASDGMDIGAIAYDGAVTAQLAGHLFSNTILTSAASPHVVAGDLTIEPGVTLTIEPGAELRFAANADLMNAGLVNNRTELRVRGTLVADGTNSLGITMTSDSMTPARGDWYGIHFLTDAAASIIDNAEIAWARYGVHSQAPAGTVVGRSTIRESQTDGAYVNGGNIEFREMIIRNNARYGVYVENADATVTRSRIYDNANRAVHATSWINGDRTIVVTNNTIVANGTAGVYLTESTGTLRATIRDNVIQGNATYGIFNSSAIVTRSNNVVWGQTTNHSGVTVGSGSLIENPLFVDLTNRDLRVTSNSPARQHASDGGTIGALAYDGTQTIGLQGHLYDDVTWSGGPLDVLGDITVETGVALTVEAGTVVRFAANADSMQANAVTNRTELRVLGRLVVDGSPQARVRLTSSAGTPARGDWYGVHLIDPTTNSSIEDAEIAWARYGIHSFAGNATSVARTEIHESQTYGVYVQGGAATWDGLLVHDNQTNGIFVENAEGTFNNAVLYNNGSRGLYATSWVSGDRTVTVNHATISGHTSAGIYCAESTGTLRMTVRNSVIASNGTYGVQNSSCIFTRDYNNVWGNTNNYSGVTAGGNSISSNPQFVDTMLLNFRLLPNSLSVDAADPATALDHDAEGVQRPIDGNQNMTAAPDMGAYEFNPSANRWPIADAGADRVVHAGTPAMFSGAGSFDPDGTIASYVWDFGDGSPTASGVSVTHTFNGGTDRIVTLTVTDNNGAIDVDVVNVEVNLPPTAEAGASRFADPGEIVSFTGTGSSDSDGTLTNYHWAFGDGSQATGVSVSHQYTTGGTYTVTLTVTDDDGATAQDTTTANITGGGGGDVTPPSITHTPVANGQIEGRAVTVDASITDNVAIASVSLNYRVGSAGNFASVVMTQGMGNAWSGTIGAMGVGTPVVEYYITALDTAGTPNTANSPATAPAAVHSFTVVAAGPSLAHAPVSDGQPFGQNVSIVATVTAPDGVGGVTLFYRVGGTVTFFNTPMMLLVGDTYQAQIPSSAATGTSVDYYVTATDMAMPANMASLPTTAPATPYSFTITAPGGPMFTHTPIADARPFGQPVQVAAQVSAASGIDSVTLNYRSGATGAYSQLPMTVLVGSTYQAEIPGTATMGTSVAYYISATDSAMPANTATEPATAPGVVHDFTVASPSGPTIVHTPIADGQPIAQGVTIDATVTAPAGVATVMLFYRPMGGGNFTSATMTNTTGDTYVGTIPGAAVTTPAMEYYIEAVDSAVPANTTTDPAMGAVHGFTVINPDTDPPQITHTPIMDGQADGSAVTVLATVTDATGVDSVNLFYRLAGGGGFAMTAMSNTMGDEWSGTIPAMSVARPGLDYYIVASDSVMPTTNSATEPANAPNTFHSFTVTRMFNVNAGDLIVTEIMHNPSGSETLREWFEIHNTTASAIDVDGLVFADDDTDSFTVSNGGPLMIAAGGYMVLGRSSDTTMNGGVTVDYVYSGFFLANTADELVIQAGGTLVDRVGYDATFPSREGYSITLDPGSLDFASNDDGASWCDATAMLSGGDFGTPGAVNDSCTPPADTAAPTIVHAPIANGQPAGLGVAVSAVITDASGVAGADLFYRVTGGAFMSVAMTTLGADTYQAEVPGAAVTGAGVDYYVRATDASMAGNEALDPATAPTTPYSFSVSTTDMVGPAINHSPIVGNQPEGTSLTIDATVTDSSGVASVTLHYQPPGGAWAQLPMMNVAGDQFSAVIDMASVTPGTLGYYIAATDSAMAQNSSVLPNTAPGTPYQVAITALDMTGPAIVHTPIADDRPQGTAIQVAATVTDASGVAEVRVYFRTAGTATFVSASMTDAGGGMFTGQIPAVLVMGAGIDYYLEASDASDEQNLTRDPQTAPTTVFSFTLAQVVVTDNEPPVIVHTPVQDGQRAGFGVIVEVNITDASGIANATLTYRTQGGASFTETALIQESGTDIYRAQIPGTEVVEAGVEYFLRAVDGSAAANAIASPSGAPAQTHKFTVAPGSGNGNGNGNGDGTPDPRDTGCSCATITPVDASLPASSLSLLFVLALLVLRRRP